MADRTAYNDLKYLFFIPSFYGALTWGAWLVLYLLQLIKLDDVNGTALTVFLSVEALFIVSAYVSFPYFRVIVKSREELPVHPCITPEQRFSNELILGLLHALGFLGLALYIVEFSRNLGGLTGFLLALVNESYAIRLESETSNSIGTQLSYFGWMAIGLTTYHFLKSKISRWWLLLTALQFIGNLLYIDRTRPFWILFSSALMILPATRVIDIKKMAKWTAITSCVLILIFWSVAEWIGKTSYKSSSEDTALPGITQDIYRYGVSGYGYFNKMVESNEEISYRPARVIYPLLKLLTKFDIVEEPPSQIHDIYYEIPFPTNAGSFLEPFYRDGGLFFVFYGALIYTFGLDYLARIFLKTNHAITLYGWSSLCFVAFIGFYNPKLLNLPTWIFLIIAIAVVVKSDPGSRFPELRH